MLNTVISNVQGIPCVHVVLQRRWGAHQQHPRQQESVNNFVLQFCRTIFTISNSTGKEEGRAHVLSLLKLGSSHQSLSLQCNSQVCIFHNCLTDKLSDSWSLWPFSTASCFKLFNLWFSNQTLAGTVKLNFLYTYRNIV